MTKNQIANKLLQMQEYLEEACPESVPVVVISAELRSLAEVLLRENEEYDDPETELLKRI